MPLPTPTVARKHIHTRTFDCRGYEREDGLWEIEGHLTDVKTYTWKRNNGIRDQMAGVPVHDMWIRLTIDLDMLIHDIVVVTDGTPYPGCGNITPNYQALKGMTIRRGWLKDLRHAVGGVHGCTHLWELLGRMAATCYQSTNIARTQHRPLQPGQIPYQFKSCHMYTPESPATLERWPHLYRGPKTPAEDPSG